MLTKEPLYYYNRLRKRFPNSYLAEDNNQIIIGIDADYIDATLPLNSIFSSKRL
mgnify:CR=1 FL=1